MTPEPPVRTYRFSPIARTGVLLGLCGLQCFALAVGVVSSGLLLNTRVLALIVPLPLVASMVFAFAPIAGRPMHEWSPIVLRWWNVRARRRTRWFGRLPSHTSGGPTRPQPDLPPMLSGITIDEITTAWFGLDHPARVAIIRDWRERTMSTVLRVRGREFSLCERSEQDRVVQQWGDALAGFCRERCAVAQVRWIEWSAPADPDEHLLALGSTTDLRADGRDQRRHAALASYRDLLERTGPTATQHETLVTITVDQRRLRRRGDGGSSPSDVLVEELRLFASRVEAAGLQVDAPLTAREVAAVFRSRLDPFSTPGRTGRPRDLAELAGLNVASAGPLAVDTTWKHVAIDAAVHATFVVVEWPRLELAANWMEPLVHHAGAIRTIAVLCEPVPPSRSRRQIERDSTRLATDAEQRTRTGFRIGARHRRAQADVVNREVELVAGYPEMEYTGVVVVTAADTTMLDRSCAEYEQIAAQCGIELRRLDGRHDLAMACILPIGRGIEPRRSTW